MSLLRPYLPVLLPTVIVAGALGWALKTGSMPKADFTFANGTEVKSLDPAIATGQPDGRLLYAIFECLVHWHPETLQPIPGAAESWELSDDGLVYTFHLRPDGKWSDGSPVTTDDFEYSLRRFLDPRVARDYVRLGWLIKNARRYTLGGSALEPGDPVEVEHNLPPKAIPTLRGQIERGTLVDIVKPQQAESAVSSDEHRQDFDRWQFVVDVDGRQQRYQTIKDADAETEMPDPGIAWCRQVLLDFREVGVRAVDPYTLEITLENVTPFFLSIMGFYPMSPVNQRCLETHGSPAWTLPENIVCNGPYVPRFRRIRDRTRLVRNEHYWNAANVALRVVDALAVESLTTQLNLYLTGEVDWIEAPPATAMRALLAQRPKRDDLNPKPMLNSYFYMINTTRAPLSDVRVRRALSLALDREEITRQILGAGEIPAYSLVPPGISGYESPQCEPRDPALARELLAEAGYPEGRGFPPISILYNTHDTHRTIADLIRKQWERELGVTVNSRNEEWATYLESQRLLRYDVSRRAWIGDYNDPNTFLEMYISGGGDNNTGFSNAQYDRLLRSSASELNVERRFAMLHEAEQILMDELPIIPIYFYVSRNLVKPYVRGFYNNLLDYHPVWALSIDRQGTTPNPHLKGRE